MMKKLALSLLILMMMAIPAMAADDAVGSDTNSSYAKNFTYQIDDSGLTWEWMPDYLADDKKTKTTAVAGTKSVDDEYTKSLLHLNGTDGSTVFTDEAGKIWSAAGNAQIDTAESVFGGASLVHDGSGDYISTSDSPDWDLGLVFTVDFWVRFEELPPSVTLTGTNAIDSRYYKPGWLIAYQRELEVLRMSYHDGSSWKYHMYSPWDASTDTWYHVAVSRDESGVLRHFINGQQTGSMVNTNSIASGPQNLFIGGINGLSANSFSGNIDEVRISKGIARWTENFTPPTHEYGIDVAPVADFTGSPVSGTRPLTVQFTDNSENDPTSWEWDFENDGTIDSYEQNPQYTYTETGCYNVRLTVTNGAGNDTGTKEGYITVTGHYYVYSDGISLYQGPGSELALANTTAQDFYENLDGKQGTVYQSIQWEGLANPVDDATGSRNWDTNYDADTMANNADFAFHVGHSWDDGLLFGTANPDYVAYRNNLSFGGNNGRAKYVALFSCNLLNQSTYSNWESVFDGLHILLGFDTYGAIAPDQGSQFVNRMTGTGTYDETQIRGAWRETLKHTIDDASINGAYMWADPSGNDYLPGFGQYYKPVKDGSGHYAIQWEYFDCKS